MIKAKRTERSRMRIHGSYFHTLVEVEPLQINGMMMLNRTPGSPVRLLFSELNNDGYHSYK